MKKQKRWIISIVLLTFILALAVPVSAAASFKTVTSKKTQYGSYYVWRPNNTTFRIQKAGTSKVKKLTCDVYTVAGTTDGTTLYYTTLAEKRAGKVTLYKYTLSSGKTTKIGVIKNALHVVYSRGGNVYGNGAKNGSASDIVYQYNVKTKTKTTLVKNFWVDHGSGKYLYGTRNDVKYRYNLSTNKLSKYNW